MEKYNKSVPETWDELIETTNYIYEKEKPLNPNLHKYLGNLADGETGLVTILEYIHSFRDSPNDKFPSYTSDNAIAALEKMKQVKEMASTDDDFSMEPMGAMFSNNSTDFIFAKHWYFMYAKSVDKFLISHIPGKVKGVSASTIGGSNFSMNRYISEDRKKAVGEVLSYIHSYETQKGSITIVDNRSAIHSTYSDPEVCKTIDCPLFSSMQSIVRPSSSTINYETYSDKFRELVTQYVYGQTDKTAKEILIEVDDIRKIHFIEFNSIPGIVIIAVTSLTVILLLSSYVYVSIKRFRNQFNFLPYGYWCIIILGLLMITSYCYTGIHELANYNCLIRPFLLTTGFDLIYTPLLLKMISIFQKKNSFSKFVKDHFTIMFLLFIIINILLNIAWYLVDPLVINKLIITSGKNFQYCNSSTIVGTIMKHVMYGLKLLILLFMCLLSFAEWNLSSFKPDIRSITSTIYTNILLISMFIIIEKINIDNRYLYFGLRAALVIVFCLSTLTIIIGTKFYYISIQKENPYPDITTFNKTSNMSSSYYSSSVNKSNLLNYHFQTDSSFQKDSVKPCPNPTLFTSTINSTLNNSYNIFNTSSNRSRSPSQSSESTTTNNNFNNNLTNNYSNGTFINSFNKSTYSSNDGSSSIFVTFNNRSRSQSTSNINNPRYDNHNNLYKANSNRLRSQSSGTINNSRPIINNNIYYNNSSNNTLNRYYDY